MDTRTTQQKHDDAKKAYDDYVASDEHKQRLGEANKTALDQAMQRVFSTPGVSASDALIGAGQQIPTDSKERELNAMVEHYRQQMEAEEDQRARDADMKEIESWSDEDRAALEEYVRGRDVRDDPLTVSNPLRYIFQTYKTAKPYSALMEKYGEERLEDLAESYSRVLHEQDAQKIVEDTTAAVGTVPGAVGHNILSVGANGIGGVLGTLGRVNEAFNRTGRYNALEAYTPGDTLNLYAGTVREATAQNIEGEDGGAGRKFLSVGYQGIMTLADSISRSLALGPAGGAALAATGSFSQTMSEATKQGASPQQAVTLGIAKAGMEYITEKIPMDEVFKVAKAGDATVLAQAFKQAGIEITTEELSLFGSMVAEAAILREKSSYNQTIGELVANGASYEEAKQQADNDVWNQVLQTAAVSGFAGGVSGGGAALVGNLTANTTPEVTAEATQEVPVEAVPAAPAVDEGQQIMEAVAAELPQVEPQQEVQPATPEMQQLEAALAETMGVQPVQQAAVDTAPAAGYDNTISPELGASVGNAGVTYTSDNQAVPFQYAVVPAESLITSNDQFGNVNSAYPAELQPRDRTRTASQIQINKMAQNLNPALLAESATAENGAPIIRGDGVVVGGNARVNAIGMAYNSGNGGAYQQFITEKAAELGIDPATLPANPVLVRITNGVDNYTGLATALNETGVKTNSPTETAKIDASKMGDIIQYLSVGEDGDLNTAQNRDFIQHFTTEVVPAGEQDTVMQGNSQVSQAGVRRMQYALFHYAYNDTALLERLAESTDNNAKNITNAMVGTAGKIAQLQTEIARGEVQDFGLQSAVTNAVNLYLDAKGGKQSVSDAAGQLTMGENGPEAQYDGLTVNLALFLESNNRSGKQIRDFIDILVDVNMNMAAETATEVSMFDTGYQQTQEGLYDEAVKAYDQQRDGKGRIPDKSDFSQYRQYQPGELATELGGSGTEGSSGETQLHGDGLGTVPADAPGGQGPVTTKGTGAAERNFSGKEEYNNLLYDGNVQRDRPTDLRPMEVPKRDSDGRRVTEFAANAYAAEVTPDHMASEIESLIQDKELSFDTRSNQESLHNAAEAIGEAGEEETRLRISRNASEDRIQNGDIEQGLLLYTKYAADPEMQDQASSLLVDLGKLANMSGRNLQMFSLLRRMTPEGRVMTVQKNVARYVQDINKGRSARQQIDSARIIDKDLEQQLRTATTNEERREIENAIYKDVASQIKPTLGEAWDAWRNLAMLGNAKTHGRNFISTGTWKPYAAVKRDISAVLQKVFLKQEQRTASILGTNKKDIDLLAWAKVDAKDQDIQERMGFSGTTGNEARNAIEENRQMLPGFLDKLAKGNRTLMEKEDMIWKRSEYARALAGFMKARGYTADQIHNGEVPNGILEDARQYAIKEAQKATFNDSNEFSDWVTSTFKPKHGRVVDPILNILKKGSVPFLRTPANVVVRAMEYNPLALGKTLLTAKRDIDSGKKSAADVVNDISAGLTGTAAMGIGAMLAAGMVPGVKLHGKVDDEDELREGVQSYSIQIGDKCYGVAWLAPAMIPLFIGANAYNKWTAQADRANDDVDGWDLVESLKDVAVDAIDPILELSTLSNLNNIIDNVAYEEDGGDKLMAFFLNAATSYMFQGLPTIFGQIEQSTEETKSSTYINTDNKTEATVKRALSSASQRIPGLDLYQTEKLNEWGEPVKNEGSPLERAMAAMFSPSSETRVKDDALTKEITRLNRVQTENVSPPSFSKIVSYTDIHGNIHANIRLTEEQYQTMARTQGQTSKRLIVEMLLSDDYKAITDEQKAKAITQAYAYARETAEKATFQDHEGYSANWMNDAAGGEPKDTAAYIMRRITNSDINSAMTSLDSAWDKNHDQAIVDRWMRELDTAYNAYSNMSKDAKSDVREFATGTTAKYLEARDNGVSHEDFLYAERLLTGIEPEAGYANPRSIQKAETIAGASGLSEAEKTVLIKQHVSDSQRENIDELKALGYGIADYVKLYRDHEDYISGNGKKKRTCEKWQQDYGITYDAAEKLYEVFS
ncbi:MAG: hypothetical protein IKT52_13520 [Oscillospiraceae bacterium]|nr:hypothetical protein [Oscillospiraceae bacterium]